MLSTFVKQYQIKVLILNIYRLHTLDRYLPTKNHIKISLLLMDRNHSSDYLDIIKNVLIK